MELRLTVSIALCTTLELRFNERVKENMFPLPRSFARLYNKSTNGLLTRSLGLADCTQVGNPAPSKNNNFQGMSIEQLMCDVAHISIRWLGTAVRLANPLIQLNRAWRDQLNSWGLDKAESRRAN